MRLACIHEGEAGLVCDRCIGLEVQNRHLCDTLLVTLDRLGALRRLQEALVRSPLSDERTVSMILKEILEADGDAVKSLPGPFWTESLDVTVEHPWQAWHARFASWCSRRRAGR